MNGPGEPALFIVCLTGSVQAGNAHVQFVQRPIRFNFRFNPNVDVYICQRVFKQRLIGCLIGFNFNSNFKFRFRPNVNPPLATLTFRSD